MTRSTDVYVSLEDRYRFANDLNATLFVSIHNNSMPNGMKGSMVLYHYTSYRERLMRPHAGQSGKRPENREPWPICQDGNKSSEVHQNARDPG